MYFAHCQFGFCQLLWIVGVGAGRWQWMTDPDIILHLSIAQPPVPITALKSIAHCYMILITVHCTNGRVQTTSGRSQAEQCTEFSGIANLHQSNRQCLGPTADPRLPKRQISFWTCNCLCFWDSHRKHSHRYITIVFVMCH